MGERLEFPATDTTAEMEQRSQPKDAKLVEDPQAGCNRSEQSLLAMPCDYVLRAVLLAERPQPPQRLRHSGRHDATMDVVIRRVRGIRGGNKGQRSPLAGGWSCLPGGGSAEKHWAEGAAVNAGTCSGCLSRTASGRRRRTESETC
jgi:hypothetical protein